MKASDKDLDNCASEPIHVPGSIQPHGCLLAFERASQRVLQVSANVEAFLGDTAQHVLARRVSEVLPPGLSRQIVAALAESAGAGPLGLSSDGLCAELQEHDGVCILEIESALLTTDGRLDLGRVFRQLSTVDALSALWQNTVELVREISGFDRVVIYRFDEDDHGEVIAEARAEDMTPYLGLHFPESDIPRQARSLYLRKWLRAIPDGRFEPVHLIPALRPDTGLPLDLSYSTLRSVSPVHLEYMANMGVQASLSVSLIIQGRLWGLISCGHRKPTPMSFELRNACETIGRMVSLQIGALQTLDLQQREAAKAPAMVRLAQCLRQPTAQGLDGLLSEPETLMRIAQAYGAAVVTGDTVSCVGDCPDTPTVLTLAQWLEDRMRRDGTYYTNHLSLNDPQWDSCVEVASGVLAITLPTPLRSFLIWFRPEQVRTVNWGGNPNKAAGARLHPRHSFDLWKQETRGRSLRWGPAEITAAVDLRRSAVEIDLYRQVQKAQAAVATRDELVAVVAHDLRSPLSVIVMQATIIQRLVAQDSVEKVKRIRASAQTMQRAGERMYTLVNDLLDLASIEAGRFEIVPSRQNVPDILRDAYELLFPVCSTADMTLVHLPSADLVICADPERLFQVLSNLIGNAVKFSGAGTEIEIGAVAVEGDFCQFAVVDRGSGIASEELPRIFERYWHGVRPAAAKGTGLGLHIAKGIVEAHGGQIWATSPPGSGTTVFFTVPLATDSEHVPG